MSVVWRAFDDVLQREVAMKVLAPGTDATVRHRLRGEARAVAKLAHPYIAPVFDYGELISEDGCATAYVVMELVRGELLARRIADAPMPWRDCVTTAAQVAAALAYAHANGIVHRDVTPANVILTASGAKVVDFGIAAAIGDRELDADGMLPGTPAYLAPERLSGSVVGTPADVYALGLLLYRCLSGRLPWSATTATEMLRAHQYVEPEPLQPLPGVPADVIDICHACISYDPAARPSALEAAFALADTANFALPLHDASSPAPYRDAPAAQPETKRVAVAA